jgi:hypothetical protein
VVSPGKKEFLWAQKKYTEDLKNTTVKASENLRNATVRSKDFEGRYERLMLMSAQRGLGNYN